MTFYSKRAREERAKAVEERLARLQSGPQGSEVTSTFQLIFSKQLFQK